MANRKPNNAANKPVSYIAFPFSGFEFTKLLEFDTKIQNCHEKNIPF